MAKNNKNEFSMAGKSLLGLDIPAEQEETVVASQPKPEPAEQKTSIEPPPETPVSAVKPPVEPVMETEKPIQSAVGRGRPKKMKEVTVKTSVELSEENSQFIEDIKTIEGGSIKTVLNSLLDDIRVNKRAALDKALEIHKQGRKTWRDME